MRNDGYRAVKASRPLEAWLREWKAQQEGQMTALAAYQVVPWVRRPVDLVTQAVSEQPFALFRDGERVATEADYRDVLPDEVNMRTLVKGLAFDLLMFGYGHWGYTGLEGYQVVKRRAAKYIRYELDTSQAVYLVEYRRGTHVRIATRWTPMADGGLPYVWEEGENDERPGTPKVMASLKAAGLLNAMADYGRYFFEGGGAGPTVFQFEGFQNSPDAEKERVQSWLDRMAAGVKNAFRPLAMGSNVEIHKVGHSVKDLEMPTLSREKREDAIVTFGVPASMVLPDAANYATAQLDKLNFHDFGVNPVFDQIADAMNTYWLSGYGLQLRSEHQRLHVYQNAELERAEKLVVLKREGVLTVNEIREETGRDPLPEPVADVAVTTSGRGGLNPVEEVQEEARPSAARSLAFTKSETKFQPNGEAFAYIPLGNEASILDLVRLLKEELSGVDGIEWQPAPTYHLTLCYAMEATGEVLRAVSDRVQARSFHLFGDGLGIFENGAERALHIRIEPMQDLIRLQSELYAALNQFGVPLSQYSNPQLYNPHITLAYLPPGVEIENLQHLGLMTSLVDSYIIGRLDYEPEVIVRAPQYKQIDKTTMAEKHLQLWRKKARKRYEEGTPEKALDFTSEAIGPAMKAAVTGALEVAETLEDVEAAFDGAEVWVGYG